MRRSFRLDVLSGRKFLFGFAAVHVYVPGHPACARRRYAEKRVATVRRGMAELCGENSGSGGLTAETSGWRRKHPADGWNIRRAA